jgi:hypothetical protein
MRTAFMGISCRKSSYHKHRKAWRIVIPPKENFSF